MLELTILSPVWGTEGFDKVADAEAELKGVTAFEFDGVDVDPDPENEFN